MTIELTFANFCQWRCDALDFSHCWQKFSKKQIAAKLTVYNDYRANFCEFLPVAL